MSGGEGRVIYGDGNYYIGGLRGATRAGFGTQYTVNGDGFDEQEGQWEDDKLLGLQAAARRPTTPTGAFKSHLFGEMAPGTRARADSSATPRAASAGLFGAINNFFYKKV